MADGIMLGKGKVKIKIKPGALRVITDLNNATEQKLTDPSAEPIRLQDPQVIEKENQNETAIKVG
jgi:hypothetical protein